MTIDIIHNPDWKQSPIRIKGPSQSWCCSWPTIIVQSMTRGFVTQNCTRCGRSRKLPKDVFLYHLDCVVQCWQCHDAMYREVLPDKNYGLVCHDCNVSVWLAAIVPDRSDVIPGTPSAAALRGI